MNKYIDFTEEQKVLANEVPITEILDRQGESYKRCGKEYYWKRHDSVKFRGAKWYRHSTGEGGYSVSFCMTFLGMDYQDAVSYLVQNTIPYNDKNRDCEYIQNSKMENHNPDILEQTNLPLKTIPRNSSNTKAYEYLTKKRCISGNIVSFFIQKQMIYESAKYHSVVFVGKDANGENRNLHCRGTLPGEGKFHHTAEGSDYRYGFGYMGEGERLYVFESSIDLLSFLTLYPEKWMENSYVALNGVSGYAMFQALQDHSNIKKVILCLDRDEAGEKAANRFAQELLEKKTYEVNRLASQRKDWNEDLQYQHNSHNRESDYIQTQEIDSTSIYSQYTQT